MVRLLKGLASGDVTVALELILNRCTETGGSYIVYLSPLYMVAVIDPQEHQNRGVVLAFGASTLRYPLGTGKKNQPRACGNLWS